MLMATSLSCNVCTHLGKRFCNSKQNPPWKKGENHSLQLQSCLEKSFRRPLMSVLSVRFQIQIRYSRRRGIYEAEIVNRPNTELTPT